MVISLNPCSPLYVHSQYGEGGAQHDSQGATDHDDHRRYEYIMKLKYRPHTTGLILNVTTTRRSCEGA